MRFLRISKFKRINLYGKPCKCDRVAKLFFKRDLFSCLQKVDHVISLTKGLLSLASRFGSFTVGFLLKWVYRHLPYKPLKLLFGKKSVRDTIKSQKQ